MENSHVSLRETNMRFSGDRVAGPGAQNYAVLPAHPRAHADSNASLGSAEVGAALSNPPTPRSGVWGAEGKLIVGNCGLGGSERDSGGWGLRRSTFIHRSTGTVKSV